MWFILIVKFVFNDISTLVGHLCCLPKNERKGIEELEERELLKVRKIEWEPRNRILSNHVDLNTAKR